MLARCNGPRTFLHGVNGLDETLSNDYHKKRLHAFLPMRQFFNYMVTYSGSLLEQYPLREKQEHFSLYASFKQALKSKEKEKWVATIKILFWPPKEPHMDICTLALSLQCDQL